MADFAIGVDDEIDDRVRIALGEDSFVDVFDSYDVSCSVLTQPASFSVSIGVVDGVPDLLKRYTPNTKFQLLIGDVPQQSGRIDGVAVRQDASSGTSFHVSGRDLLAPLHDTYIEDEKTYSDATYLSLVQAFLNEVGLDGIKINSDNAANRKLTTGVQVVSRSEPTESVTTEDLVDLVLSASGGETIVHRTLRTRLGIRRYEFLIKELAKGGLFIWCTAKGEFVLAAPNAKQKPTYRIYRSEGIASNVLDSDFVNDTAPRYSEAAVLGRGAGRKKGRHKALGLAVDPEMQALGFKRAITVRDPNIKDHKVADTIALRKLAEGRRRGWRLRYTVAGHSAPSLVGGGRAVWAPDTVVELHDDLLGISGNFWISDVQHRRSRSGSTSSITLVRLNDLLFGSDE